LHKENEETKNANYDLRYELQEVNLELERIKSEYMAQTKRKNDGGKANMFNRDKEKGN
jgi:hypothetical protein